MIMEKFLFSLENVNQYYLKYEFEDVYILSRKIS